MISFIIKSYFFANVFLAGFGFHNDLDWAKTRKDYFSAYGNIILVTFFGILIYLYVFLEVKLKFLLSSIGFLDWYYYYFTSKFTNLKIDQLDFLNNSIKGQIAKNYKERSALRLIHKINKRNNYILNDSAVK